MNTTNHEAEVPRTTTAPTSQNGHLPGELGGSRSVEPDGQLARENAKLAQENAQLLQERDLLRALIDGLPDNIFVKDRQCRFLISNSTHIRTLGASKPEDVLGKTDTDIFPAEQAAQYRADEEAVMGSGQPMNRQETVVNPRTGEKRWLQTTKVPLRNKNGAVVGLFGISRDITDLKRTEEELHRAQAELEKRIDERTAELSRERLVLRTLIDSLPDCIYAKDINGRKTMANPADLVNLGCKSEADAIGKSDFDFFPRELAEKFWADDQKVLEGNPVINREEIVSEKNAKKRWLLTSKLPLRDPSGKITGLVGIGRDISENKLAEEALVRERLLLRTLIDNLPDSVFVKDSQSRFVVVNTACAQQLGVGRPEEVFGKSDADFVTSELAAQYRADEQALMQSGQPVHHEERTQHKTLGEMRWSLTSKIPLKDDAGKPAGLVGIARDITERRRAEDALRTSERKLRQFTIQLERSNRELQDFAYVASHDLQEPLRKIVVFGERIKEKGSSTLVPEALDYLDRMQKAAARMQTLINDLLTFSRITTKAQPFSSVNLAEVASGVVEDLEGRIELVKGRVEVGPLPVIDAEPLQMRQLLQNLIGNALKFRRPEEPPVVKVNAEIIPDPVTPEKKLCRLTVNDNCIGFDEKYLDRIFNVFQRLHTRNEYEGTGMGLAIVRKIALYHGGDITARSKPGEGSTFILTIPIVHSREAQTENTNQESKQP